MKLRLLALSAVLLTLSYAAPRSRAQEKDGAATPTSATAAKSTPPTPTQAPHPEKVKQSGSQAALKATGQRNDGCKTGVSDW